MPKLSEWVVRFRFNRARLLMEMGRWAEALAVLQDERP
ncbi:hypothetical protein LCGC14_1762160 [marine sediment metagenome]|uniref:Tetratricopeptide repeat protein n=1 Tax=marine sediment metagenome TaxID=412755 RepID=A0A0F9H0S9_9ZZZZ